MFVVLCGVSFNATSQTDMELAEYYYANGEFEQAKLYYEKIYKKDRTNRVYENYLGTLMALNNFEESEALVKKKLKSTKDKSKILVELGSLYAHFEKWEDADENYQKAIKELQPGRSNAIRLGNQFIKLNEYDLALETYKKAKKLANDGYGFNYEVANLRGTMGDHEGMIDAFLDLLKDNPNYTQTVQNSINRNLNVVENESNADMLKNKLLKKVQSDPEVAIYNEMLIWLFIQKKEFAGAFIQAKALDKRLNENGYRIINLAQLAVTNEDYETGSQAYQYLIEKGPTGDYYITARIEKLKTLQKEILKNPSPEETKMRGLAEEYEVTIAELGKTASTAPILMELAHIRGFYLKETDKAIDLLYDAIEIPGLYENTQALCKLELGNVLLLQDRIWDAGLLYTQVELDFKDDALGHEAKLSNAKISYYTGDFEWAQAQLDILKASTSKLISNDAIDLSLLITDNYNMDTTTVPMEMFAMSELLAYQGQYADAFEKLDSIVEIWPGHTLTDDIFMLKGDVYYKQGMYEDAQLMYQNVLDMFFMDINADDALFNLAEMNNYIFNEKDLAQEMYQRIILEYPASLYVIEARKKFRELRGDELN